MIAQGLYTVFLRILGNIEAYNYALGSHDRATTSVFGIRQKTNFIPETKVRFRGDSEKPSEKLSVDNEVSNRERR